MTRSAHNVSYCKSQLYIYLYEFKYYPLEALRPKLSKVVINMGDLVRSFYHCFVSY